MKLLLDECVPEDLKEFITGHEVFTAAEMRWKGIKNGELMRHAVESGFEAFLTVDKNIRHQQNISKFALSGIIFDVRYNTLEILRQKLPDLYTLLSSVEKGKLYSC